MRNSSVLKMWLKFRNYQNGTIHQAMVDAYQMDMNTLDRFCGLLVDNLSKIEDIENVGHITQHRLTVTAKKI